MGRDPAVPLAERDRISGGLTPPLTAGGARQGAAAGRLEATLDRPGAWVARDDFRLDDPAVVGGLFRSLLFVTQVQDTPLLPDGDYATIEDRLIETVVDGLFVEA